MVTQTQGKTILCTWEIGGELGHISRYSAIVKALELDGHHVVLALKDLSRAYPFFCTTKATLMQAPIWLPRVTMQRPIACLADTLLCQGYLDADPLDCLVQAWESLIASVKPDLVIFDYAPTAMLALRHSSIPKILIGTGFADPVPGRPIADWRPYVSNDDLIARQEQRVLQQINTVLERRQQPALGQLADLFAVDRVVISTFPELDLYADRPDTDYCAGPTTQLVDNPVRFNNTDRPRILAYLKPAHPHIEQLVTALARSKAHIFIACPKGPAQLFTPHASDHFQFTTDLVDLQGAMSQVDLFVGHGNASSVKESIVAGIPAIVLPIQLEQLLTGKKIQQAGYGVLIEKLPGVEEMTKLIDDVLINSESYRQNIEELLKRHPEPRLCVAEAVGSAVRQLLRSRML